MIQKISERFQEILQKIPESFAEDSRKIFILSKWLLAHSLLYSFSFPYGGSGMSRTKNDTAEKKKGI